MNINIAMNIYHGFGKNSAGKSNLCVFPAWQRDSNKLQFALWSKNPSDPSQITNILEHMTGECFVCKYNVSIRNYLVILVALPLHLKLVKYLSFLALKKTKHCKWIALRNFHSRQCFTQTSGAFLTVHLLFCSCFELAQRKRAHFTCPISSQNTSSHINLTALQRIISDYHWRWEINLLMYQFHNIWSC